MDTNTHSYDQMDPAEEDMLRCQMIEDGYAYNQESQDILDGPLHSSSSSITSSGFGASTIVEQVVVQDKSSSLTHGRENELNSKPKKPLAHWLVKPHKDIQAGYIRTLENTLLKRKRIPTSLAEREVLKLARKKLSPEDEGTDYNDELEEDILVSFHDDVKDRELQERVSLALRQYETIKFDFSPDMRPHLRSFFHQYEYTYAVIMELSKLEHSVAIVRIATFFDLWDDDNNTFLSDALDYRKLEQRCKGQVAALTSLQEQAITYKLIQTPMSHTFTTARGGGTEYGSEFVQMKRTLYEAIGLLSFHVMMRMEGGSVRGNMKSFEESDHVSDYLLKTNKQEKPQSPFARIYLYVIKQVRKLELVRRKEHFLREKMWMDPTTQKVYGTCYYEIYDTIEDFVGGLMNKDTQYELWDMYYSKQSVRAAVIYALTFGKDSDLKDHRGEWGLVAFRRHLYCAVLETAWLHCDPEKPKQFMAQVYIDDELDTRPIHKSCMEMERDENGNVYPIIQMLRDQGYDNAEIETAAAIIGRALYPVKTDGHELCLFMKGVGGSGKSSLCKLIQSFYENHDVAILANKTEEVFGLESFIDKKLILAMDLTKAANIDVGDMLSLTTGDPVAIRRKNKGQIFTEILAHFVGACNRFPSTWMDIDGNFLRRLFHLDFPNVPKVPDETFKNRLVNSGGMAYRFFNIAYQRLRNGLSREASFWDQIPERFLKNRMEFLANTNKIVAFLEDCRSQIQLDDRNYWLEEDFVARFVKWCKRYQLKIEQDDTDPKLLASKLLQMGLKRLNVSKMWPLVATAERKPLLVHGEFFIVGMKFLND
ncbi:MAG: putative superfamily III helicase [Sylvanvirus sp.]|uniref:Putative superfamily III helicase n=1 Tax=Sylvanvirus sp. TaxID=2487774 RepID=A0A3G5AJD1_9VIRU|nr:MAG: putative superfamily III helicase [Sylvanvirus sp.]